MDPNADIGAEAAAFRPAFSHLALLVQVPGVDVAARVEAEKGSPLTDRETAILHERVAAARGWLDAYAPERAVVKVKETLPAETADLDPSERTFLAALADTASDARLETGDAWQDAIFRTAGAAGIEAKAAFTALYVAFLGRPNGPRAGWLLASMDTAFVIERLRAAGGIEVVA
jgi:lysyl-tRNA synthetase class 1